VFVKYSCDNSRFSTIKTFSLNLRFLLCFSSHDHLWVVNSLRRLCFDVLFKVEIGTAAELEIRVLPG
jgi:hypothetical protein